MAKSTLPFDETIFAEFERCRKQNILRTDPLAPNVIRRRLPGKLGLVAAFEPDLFLKKRPAALPPEVSVDEPFDPAKFNFNLVKNGGEKLLSIPYQNEDHSILVNVSPLMFGHGLLIPWCSKCLPQSLTADAISLAFHTLQHSKSNRVRIGFNSLGAFSSVNHLHLHILYPDQLNRATNGYKPGALFAKQHGFPIEHAPIQRTLKTTIIAGSKTDSSSFAYQVDILEWKAPCFSFSSHPSSLPECNDANGINNGNDVRDFQAMKDAVVHFVSLLQSLSIPHNVLFAHDENCQKLRVIVLPRQPQHHFDADTAGFNAALGEISGYLVAKTKEHFLNFDEEKIIDLFQDKVACDEAIIERLCLEIEKRYM